MVNLRNLGVKKKMLTYGTFGAGVLLATAVVAGVGKLVGHCVDKFVDAKRFRFCFCAIITRKRDNYAAFFY